MVGFVEDEAEEENRWKLQFYILCGDYGWEMGERKRVWGGCGTWNYKSGRGRGVERKARC